MSNSVSPSRYIKNVMQNGIGRHVCQLQRITLSFCKENNSSRGTRDFIENYLLDFTKANPGIVIYLKPRRHRRPLLKADYLNGYTESINLAGLSEEVVCQWVGQMRGRSGTQIQRLIKDWHTDTPSIQGAWHPFLFKDTSLNVTDLRDRSLHEYKPIKKSATEKLQQIYREHSKLEDSENDLQNVPQKLAAVSS